MNSPLRQLSAAEAMRRIDVVVAHAWMVRTFLKHAPEVEEDVERMAIPREIFDFARAVESRRDDPVAYLKMVRKKLGKLRAAANRFAAEQPDISNHTNFQQAALSLAGCVAAIQEILDATEPSVAHEPPTENPQ